ncbi:hypothetical protein HB364_29560 [Pseudoflavitalea sp. X16]|uniref:hypothetical protein n=1 Tax=Paraflavitalea devenefica TaxID=2716334 RepID=UPI001422F182|nr:hypothetical protein [Paraflavitalea devenefica]NII29263.1 hypothetical protein [Paraflavitalea devenefica]
MIKRLLLLALLINLVPLVYDNQGLFVQAAHAQFGEEDDIYDFLDDWFDDDDFEDDVVDDCMNGSSVVIINNTSSTYTVGNAIYQENCTQRIYACEMQSDPPDCSTTLIGYVPDPTDCAGVPNGSAYWADCGCIGGSTGIYECPDDEVDCAGVTNGSAYWASCGCIGGTTGISECPPPVDCAGVTNGSAYWAPCGCIGGTTGITECACPNTPFPAANATVASGAPPTEALGPDDWGLTYPENVEVDISACLEGGSWKAIVTTMHGKYSLQARLLPGFTQVTGIGGNTTDANFCTQVEDLKGQAYNAGATWFIIEAVVAHENVHATRFEPGLEAVTTTIETDIEALSVPNTGQTEADAISAIKALPGWSTALTNAQGTWLAQILTLVAGDHAPGGPTDVAEFAIINPLVATICSHATTNSWPVCVHCP